MKKVVGIILLFIGFLFLVTPLTPGAGLLIFLGLEMLGLRFLFWRK